MSRLLSRPTTVGTGRDDNLVESKLSVLLDEVFELGRVVLGQRLEQPGSTTRVRVVIRHAVRIHGLVRGLSKPFRRRPVHESLSEVDTIGGDVGRTARLVNATEPTRVDPHLLSPIVPLGWKHRELT
jgi:hypothetical protein